MTTIYVSNLPNDTDLEQARTLFSSFGTVSSIKLTLGEGTRRYQGYGFVEMEEQAARAAIAELDGTLFEGAIICVDEASIAQLERRSRATLPPPGQAQREQELPSNIMHRYYQVASVEKVSSPGGDASDDWYRYELENGDGRITGFHRGSLEEVTEYATDCATAFNQRSKSGKTGRPASPTRKK